MITGLIVLALLTLTGYTACIKDNCGNTICDNGGVCVQGRCACPSGYEGDFCQNRWNEKFEGNWQADDSMVRIATHSNYPIVIKNGGTKDSFYVEGMADTIGSMLCVRTSRSKFSFVSDRKLDSVLTFKSGVGTMDSITGQIKGAYLLQKKLKTKDTLMTVHFSWKR